MNLHEPFRKNGVLELVDNFYFKDKRNVLTVHSHNHSQTEPIGHFLTLVGLIKRNCPYATYDRNFLLGYLSERSKVQIRVLKENALWYVILKLNQCGKT